MKSELITCHKTLLLSLLLVGALVIARPEPAKAQETEPAPRFRASRYALAVLSQQVILEAGYFQEAGEMDELILTSGEAQGQKLTLAPGATTGVYRSEPLRSPLGHTTDVGMAWQAEVPDGASLSVEARLSGDGQNWEAWRPVPVAYYPVRDGAYGSVLLWVDRDTAYIQFRLQFRAAGGGAPNLERLTLFFSDSSQGPSTQEAAAAAQAREAAAGLTSTCPARPTIISRTDWGCPDGQSSPRWTPNYWPVTHVVINHSATPNTADDWAKVARAIWNYHANTLGWGDVGYNYMVDPLGHVYEGRAGGDNGDELDVVGAFDGYNRGALGIGYIGCYGNCEYLGIASADPPTAMLEAGNALMAWKAGQKGIDPLGSGDYCEAILPNIVGRSDVTCRGPSLSPGNRLEARIPWIREQVRGRIAACETTISGTVLLQGRVGHKNTDHGGTAISLSAVPCPAAWTQSPSAPLVVTDADGRFELTPDPDLAYQYLCAFHPAYLVGQKSTPLDDTADTLDNIHVGTVTLPGGDVTGDGCVDIFDLTLVGACYRGAAGDERWSDCRIADINGSGRVDVYDLAITGGNDDRCSPHTGWRK